MIEEKLIVLIDRVERGNSKLTDISKEVHESRELHAGAFTSRSDAHRVSLRIDASLATISSDLTALYWVVVGGLALLISIAAVDLW